MKEIVKTVMKKRSVSDMYRLNW